MSLSESRSERRVKLTMSLCNRTLVLVIFFMDVRWWMVCGCDAVGLRSRCGGKSNKIEGFLHSRRTTTGNRTKTNSARNNYYSIWEYKYLDRPYYDGHPATSHLLALPITVQVPFVSV